mmetsp:Transcript_55316/g.132471  ORF Transcript_55316/g.132471 Transcript_55316/m.132471 type:complete len:226 (+) Transcript_55316:321-998(+)
MISCIETSLVSHSFMRSSKGLTKGELRIACVLTMWSSKSDWISSSPRRMKVPVSRYTMQSKSIGFHSLSILSSAFSSDISLEATSDCSLIASSWSPTFCSSREKSVVMAVGCAVVTPVFSASFFQCRSRMPGLRSAVTSGMTGMKASTSFLICIAISPSPAVSAKVLESLYMLRCALASSFSIISGSSEANWPSFHSDRFLVQLPAVSQSVAYGSKVLAMAASCE